MSVVCKRTEYAMKAMDIPKYLGEDSEKWLWKKYHTVDGDEEVFFMLTPALGGEERDNYYAEKDTRTSEVGHDRVFQEYMDNEVFIEENITNDYSEFVDEPVYNPTGSRVSCVNKIEINEKIGLIAGCAGITQHSETVIIYDEYWGKTKPITKLPPYIINDIRIKMLGTMAVWKARKCIYILSKMGNKTITLDFDSDRWESILSRLKEIDYFTPPSTNYSLD